MYSFSHNDSHVLQLPIPSLQSNATDFLHYPVNFHKHTKTLHPFSSVNPPFSSYSEEVHPREREREGWGEKERENKKAPLTAMTEVLHSRSSTSSSTCTPSPPKPSPTTPHALIHGAYFETGSSSFNAIDIVSGSPSSSVSEEEKEEDGEASSSCSSSSSSSSSNVVLKQERGTTDHSNSSNPQLPLLALLLALFRKSLITCKSDGEELGMEIGLPTNVRHVAHVTFDRFNGFLGLPVEFEPEVPRKAPSASANVFGVSTESMQLSYDPRGNSVPTILLLMQRQLYAQRGLQVEGIFRITAEKSQELYVRDQLNRGVVPDGTDVHCIAGLIKAWFRELPNGVLDSLSPEQVIQCESDEDCYELVRLLPSTEASLLDWAVNLMADVAQQEHVNKMNARNIALVFAPNMTKMADPLTALMHAVQVMNLLKTLILKTLQDREDSMVEAAVSNLNPSNYNEHRGPAQKVYIEYPVKVTEEIDGLSITEIPRDSNEDSDTPDGESNVFFTPAESLVPDGDGFSEATVQVGSVHKERIHGKASSLKAANVTSTYKPGQSTGLNVHKNVVGATFW